MARIGLSGIHYGVLTGDAYGAPTTIGKAVAAKISLSLNSAELYADDALAETDYTFSKGSITITVDEDNDTVLAALLGRTLGSSPAEIVRKSTDMAPYVGIGRVITKIVNGVYKYKAEFLPKVKFMDVMPDEKTKGEKVEFATVDLMGTISELDDHTWSKTATFATAQLAADYLDTCFGVDEG